MAERCRSWYSVSKRGLGLRWVATAIKWEREKGRSWSAHVMNKLIMIIIISGGVKSSKRFTLEQAMKVRRG
jgi:hypothetical protein